MVSVLVYESPCSTEGLKVVCVPFAGTVRGQNKRLSIECRFQDRYINAIIIIIIIIVIKVNLV